MNNKSDAAPATPETPQWAFDAADELDAATITICGDEKQSAQQRRVYVARIIAGHAPPRILPAIAAALPSFSDLRDEDAAPADVANLIADLQSALQSMPWPEVRPPIDSLLARWNSLGWRDAAVAAASLTGSHPALSAILAERDKLARFKAYVWKRLDDAGVPVDPDSPHTTEGCRIGGRLDVLAGRVVALEAEVARLEERNALAVAVAEASSELYDAGGGWQASLSDGDVMRRISVACEVYREAVEAYRATAGELAAHMADKHPDVKR